MTKIVLLVHDIRSTHNVGSLLRTAECFGIEKVFFTGYTPYPATPNDDRLPYIAAKLSAQIHKTALGAEELVPWAHETDIHAAISSLKESGYTLVALEQTSKSTPLQLFEPPQKMALLIGREVEGISEELLSVCDSFIEIPQFGQKESLNVVQATAIALYRLTLT